MLVGVAITVHAWGVAWMRLAISIFDQHEQQASEVTPVTNRSSIPPVDLSLSNVRGRLEWIIRVRVTTAIGRQRLGMSEQGTNQSEYINTWMYTRFEICMGLIVNCQTVAVM